MGRLQRMTRKTDYWKDPEKHRAKSRAYRELHKKDYNDRAKAWASANPERVRERRQKWKTKHPERYQRLARQCHLQKKYGISLEDQDQLLIQQGHRCAICQQILTEIHIDHNHETGRVRGILCRGCNLGIGFLKEDAAVLKKALRYLEERIQ
jgi:hypothetical protein